MPSTAQVKPNNLEITGRFKIIKRLINNDFLKKFWLPIHLKVFFFLSITQYLYEIRYFIFFVGEGCFLSYFTNLTLDLFICKADDLLRKKVLFSMNLLD